jgi:hypothetical protein
MRLSLALFVSYSIAIAEAAITGTIGFHNEEFQHRQLHAQHTLLEDGTPNRFGAPLHRTPASQRFPSSAANRAREHQSH